METIDVKNARRLALAKAGLMKPDWLNLPHRIPRKSEARKTVGRIISHFGYLQLDTISVAGARSHTMVLLSRLANMDPALGEDLLQPGEPLFEYWGHEVSWIPVEMYGLFAFRRERYRKHPWWGDIISPNRKLVDDIMGRIRKDGPIRSADLEGASRGGGWWNHKPAKRVVVALWTSGDLAIRERKSFQRTFDLPERVIPARLRRDTPRAEAVRALLLKALEGHGWARTGTMSSTWRLTRMQPAIKAGVEALRDAGDIIPCRLTANGSQAAGWIRPADLELADRLSKLRPRSDLGVLLSPFDPVLWDRVRVKTLFDFDQRLEVFTPAPKRVFGYFCLPVLAGERLIGRVDLKADRKAGKLTVLSVYFEGSGKRVPADDREAMRSAVENYAAALDLKLTGSLARSTPRGNFKDP